MTNLSPKDKAMKSKEEILDEASKCYNGKAMTWGASIKAMDQYSEQIAIGFAEWIMENAVENETGWSLYKLYSANRWTAPIHTSEELYNLYKQTLK